ncbi:AAA family ATPase [Deinococcus hohokamensis]|uniref:AAA family ATPase n=1 Tax=Deinococcus hohokamensis TaxID=309883 RepID=A0ABV9I8A4_9DEIO
MTPQVLVISGLPAAGKTTLATALAAELRWPLVTRDEYKAVLLKGLPAASPRDLGPLSFALMWQVAGVILRSGRPLILETHFHRPQSEGHILDLAREYGAALAQIFCEAQLPELARRHAERVASGRRPGIDLPFEHAALPPQACWAPLNLGPAPLLRVDTTGPAHWKRALSWLCLLDNEG